MQHRIETNFETLDDLISATEYEIAGHIVSYGFTGRRVYVIVKGNGAMLRDVVDYLDRAGFLD